MSGIERNRKTEQGARNEVARIQSIAMGYVVGKGISSRKEYIWLVRRRAVSLAG